MQIGWYFICVLFPAGERSPYLYLMQLLCKTRFSAALKPMVSPTSLCRHRIACICYASVNIKVLEILRYAEHICNYVVILDSWFYGKLCCQFYSLRISSIYKCFYLIHFIPL